MLPEMRSDATWSFREGRAIIEQKGLLDDLPDIARAFDAHGGGNQNYSARADELDPLGWEQEVSARFEALTADGSASRRVSFDAYKDGVLLEHERGEQMRANWHLLKMEAAHRDPRGFDDGRHADAAVLLIPDYVNFPTLERTENDVQAVLANYFGFSIPLLVWQYPTED